MNLHKNIKVCYINTEMTTTHLQYLTCTFDVKLVPASSGEVACPVDSWFYAVRMEVVGFLLKHHIFLVDMVGVT